MKRFKLPDPDASFLVRFEFVAFWIWVLVGGPVSFLLRESVVWVVVMSWYTIIEGHLTGWHAARAEQKAEK